MELERGLNNSLILSKFSSFFWFKSFKSFLYLIISSSIKDTEELLLCEAGYKAYQQLKTQGSA